MLWCKKVLNLRIIAAWGGLRTPIEYVCYKHAVHLHHSLPPTGLRDGPASVLHSYSAFPPAAGGQARQGHCSFLQGKNKGDLVPQVYSSALSCFSHGQNPVSWDAHLPRGWEGIKGLPILGGPLPSSWAVQWWLCLTCPLWMRQTPSTSHHRHLPSSSIAVLWQWGLVNSLLTLCALIKAKTPDSGPDLLLVAVETSPCQL